jgi:thioredoxin reductase
LRSRSWISPNAPASTLSRKGTNIPRILAIGDISSPLKMIVTAVAQAAVAAHQAYVEVRSPYWK